MIDPVRSTTPLAERPELGMLLSQLGAVVLSTETIDTTVRLVTSLAADTIAGSAGAGVTVVDDRGLRTVAASNGLVDSADALQYRLEEGPCITASRDKVPVRIDDILEDPRWPAWNATVRDFGVRSLLSVPLVAGGVSVGAIKVYSTSPAAFDNRAEQILGRFAQQAAILLANMQTLADARRINGQLTDALKTREIIGQAKGILLAQGAVDAEDAFAMLVRAAQTSDTQLRSVAQQLVDAVVRGNSDRSAPRAG